MAEKIDDWDWEDRISQGFQQLVVQDKETGECWTVSEENECLTTFDRDMAAPSSSQPKVNSWKIPKEYSLLGCNSSVPCTSSVACTGDVQPILADEDLNSTVPSWTCVSGDAENTAIIATFPPAGKLPAFCRKRRNSAALSAISNDPEKKSSSERCGVESFLEGRERLLFVGRLLFAFLVLLSPGYFFPLLFFIRTYCHYWKHSTGDQEDEVFINPTSGAFGFLHSKTFLKYSCRLCREHMKTEKMFRIHSKIGPGSLNKNTGLVNFNGVSGECLHNHDDY